MARHLCRTASRPRNPHLARRGRARRNRIPGFHPSGFRRNSSPPQSEGDVQPLGRRRSLYRSSKAAEGAARQDRAAGWRPDDDRIRRHARLTLSPRHAGLSDGAGQSRVAPDADRPARGTADRVSRLRHDGEAAGIGAEIARVSGLGLGSLAAGCGRSPDFSRPRPARAVSEPDRHRRLPVAADQRNRGDLLRPHLCDDAKGGDADKCRPRQARGVRGSDRGARFGAVVLRRIGRAVARAAAARQPALDCTPKSP